MAIMRMKEIPATFVAKINIKETLLDAIASDERSQITQDDSGRWFKRLGDSGVNVPISAPNTELVAIISTLLNTILIINNADDSLFDVTCKVKIKNGKMLFDVTRAIKQIIGKPGCNEMVANTLIKYCNLVDSEH